MPTLKNPSKLIDSYIRKQPEWAQGICERLRKAIHKADRKIVEDWKWSSPAFDREGIVCFFWTTKKNVKLYFFHGAALKDRKNLFDDENKAKERSRSIAFETEAEVKKLEKALIEYVREAVKVNVEGKQVKHKPRAKKSVVIPGDLKAALMGVGLLENFKTLPYYLQRGYVQWITTPKRMETRLKRIEELISQVTNGKEYTIRRD